MANRNREGIRNIVWLRFFFQSEKSFDHEANLLFVGISDSDNTLFDFRRRIFSPFDPGVCGGEENDSEAFCDIHAGGDILCKKESLGRHRIRFVLFDELGDSIANEFESVRHQYFRSFDEAVVVADESRTLSFDDAVADSFQSRVDSKYQQVSEILTQTASIISQPIFLDS